MGMSGGEGREHRPGGAPRLLWGKKGAGEIVKARGKINITTAKKRPSKRNHPGWQGRHLRQFATAEAVFEDPSICTSRFTERRWS